MAALLPLAGLRLGYGAPPAVVAALLYDLATMAWPHSKTFFAEPLAGGPSLALGAAWAGIALALIVAGALLLQRVTNEKQ